MLHASTDKELSRISNDRRIVISASYKSDVHVDHLLDKLRLGYAVANVPNPKLAFIIAPPTEELAVL